MVYSVRTFEARIHGTARRRTVQAQYAQKHGIVPQSIVKPIDMSLVAAAEGDYVTMSIDDESEVTTLTPQQRNRLIAELEE